MNLKLKTLACYVSLAISKSFTSKNRAREKNYLRFKVKWGDSKNKQIQKKTRESDVKQINRRELIDHKLNTDAVMSFQTIVFLGLNAVIRSKAGEQQGKKLKNKISLVKVLIVTCSSFNIHIFLYLELKLFRMFTYFTKINHE